MHFDDRLATVLRQPATGSASNKVIARIQYCQLLDLLGTLPSEANGTQIDAAYNRLSEISAGLEPTQRAQLLAAPGLRLRSPRLVAALAQSEPPVAAAAIAAARMHENEWLDLIPALPPHARGILRYRRDLGPKVQARLDRLGVSFHGLPDPDQPATELTNSPDNELEVVGADPIAQQRGSSREADGIGALVRRIEAFRKTRDAATTLIAANDAPRLPLDDGEDEAQPRHLLTFDFTTDTEGRINWAESSIAPMAFGLRLGLLTPESPVQCRESLSRAIRGRQPISGELVTIAGAPALLGYWQIDAVPRFEKISGRFTGYSGRARRPAPTQQRTNAEVDESDRMREILHELRTPMGAIQMSAEVIQQQLYGPTPHEYRALAATIASDTARVLAGFEELERLVRLSAATQKIDVGESDLAQVVMATVAQLQAHTDPRKSGFAVSLDEEALAVGLDRHELERLVWRLLASLAGPTAPSETLDVHCWLENGLARMDVTLPESLASRSDDELFQAKADLQPQALSAGMFGLGFTLRLAAAEACAAGGSLQRHGDVLQLALPLLTAPSANLSQA